MTIKTFNLDNGIYKKFMNLCKDSGISMSKQIEFFMRSQVEEKKEVREDYLRRLSAIRQGKFIKIKNLKDLL